MECGADRGGEVRRPGASRGFAFGGARGGGSRRSPRSRPPETGADRDRVYEAAIRQAATLDSLYCVSTLDNLRASGRISAAGKMLGSALSIKPILHMVDGTMTLRERHRTFPRRSPRCRRARSNRRAAGR